MAAGLTAGLAAGLATGFGTGLRAGAASAGAASTNAAAITPQNRRIGLSQKRFALIILPVNAQGGGRRKVFTRDSMQEGKDQP
jgi:hypothetical protein